MASLNIDKGSSNNLYNSSGMFSRIPASVLPWKELEDKKIKETTKSFQDIELPFSLFSYPSPQYIEERSEKIRKLEELRNDIGDELYHSLSEEDKDFILKTEGVVDFGFKLNPNNLQKIEKYLREDYEY